MNLCGVSFGEDNAQFRFSPKSQQPPASKC